MNTLRLAAIVLVLCGASCETKPVPFEEGDVMPTPAGCVDGRARDVDC